MTAGLLIPLLSGKIDFYAAVLILFAVFCRVQLSKLRVEFRVVFRTKVCTEIYRSKFRLSACQFNVIRTLHKARIDFVINSLMYSKWVWDLMRYIIYI